MKLISPVLIFVGTAVIKLRNNLIVCVFLIGFSPSLVFADECVVLLHGLARISNSMGEPVSYTHLTLPTILLV